MKKVIAVIAFGVIVFGANAQSKKDLKAQNDTLKAKMVVLENKIQENEEKMSVDLTNEKEKFSYALGLSFASNLKQQGIDSVEAAAIAKALADFENGQSQLSLEEANMAIQTYMQTAQEKQFAVVKEAGEKFLAENAKKEGVTVLPSGLQYEIITEGTGPKPAATDKVTTHYHGQLITGEVFDSSVERGSPASFPVNGVIQGWQEALQLMPVGSKWKLYIPYNLAYGDRGAGGKIQPYSALVFEVELISIDK